MEKQKRSPVEQQKLLQQFQTLVIKHHELSTGLQIDDYTTACEKVNCKYKSSKDKVLASFENMKMVHERDALILSEALGSDNEEYADDNALTSIEKSRDRKLELVAARKSKLLAAQLQIYCYKKKDVVVSILSSAAAINSILTELQDGDGGKSEQSSIADVYVKPDTLTLAKEVPTELSDKSAQLKEVCDVIEEEKQQPMLNTNDLSILLEQANTKIASLEQAAEIANTKIECLNGRLVKAERAAEKTSLKDANFKDKSIVAVAAKDVSSSCKESINCSCALDKQELVHKLEQYEASHACKSKEFQDKQNEVKALVEELEKLSQKSVNLEGQLRDEKIKYGNFEVALDTTNKKLNVELEKEKDDHLVAKKKLADVQRRQKYVDALLEVGRDARNGFMEMVDRHFDIDRRFIPLHGGSSDKNIVDIRNTSVHDGNIHADISLYALRYRQVSDVSRFQRVYGVSYKNAAYLHCRTFVEIANLHGTMYKNKAWTPYSVDKAEEMIFKKLYDECMELWAVEVKLNMEKGNPVVFDNFNADTQVMTKICAMKISKTKFMNLERARQLTQ